MGSHRFLKDDVDGKTSSMDVSGTDIKCCVSPNGAYAAACFSNKSDRSAVLRVLAALANIGALDKEQTEGQFEVVLPVGSPTEGPITLMLWDCERESLEREIPFSTNSLRVVFACSGLVAITPQDMKTSVIKLGERTCSPTVVDTRGAAAHGFTPNGQHYFTTRGNKVLFTCLESKIEEELWDSGDSPPLGVMFSPTSREVLMWTKNSFATIALDTVARLNVTTNTPLFTRMEFAPNGRMLALEINDGESPSLIFVHPHGDAPPIRVFGTRFGDAPIGYARRAFTSDSKYFVGVEIESPVVSVFDTTSGVKYVGSYPNPSSGVKYIQVAPKGYIMITTLNDNTILAMDVSGSATNAHILSDIGDAHAVFNSAGTELHIVADSGDYFRLNTADGGCTKIEARTGLRKVVSLHMNVDGILVIKYENAELGFIVSAG
jgi:WD40 repeat protein